MPKQRLLIIIASCLMIVGIVGVLLTFSTSGSAEEVEKTEVIQNPAITDVLVKSDNASIEVLPTTEDEITVEFTASESKHNKYKLDINEEGTSLSIELNQKTIKFLNFGLDFDFKGPKIKVYLPEKQYEELTVDVINGKVHAENIAVADVNVKTINGKVKLENVHTNNTVVSSENGGIVFDHVEGQVSSDVVNGSTTFITDNLDQSIDLESVNGKIKVQSTKEPTNATISVSVVNGKVDFFGNDSRSAVIGDGEHKINLTTVNGSITVSK
jgi:DUF4097 and DUF4098 domain-containing protein YvlB